MCEEPLAGSSFFTHLREATLTSYFASITALSRTRSLFVSRRMAIAITGPSSFENPRGSPGWISREVRHLLARSRDRDLHLNVDAHASAPLGLEAAP